MVASKSNKEQTSFYHVSTNVDSLKTFLHEGVKNTDFPLPNGFYVWQNEEMADTHIRLLENGLLNKRLNQHQALIIEFHVPTEQIIYPTWQVDVELAPGLLELFNKHQLSINQKLKNVTINLPPNDSLLSKITSISCQKNNQETTFIFQGKTPINTDLSYSLTCYQNQNPCHQNSDILYLQTLVDVLHKKEPSFTKEYQQLMQNTPNASFKYTGQQPLPVSMIKHVQIDEHNQLNKNILYDSAKGFRQICPFLRLKNVQR